MWIELSGVGWSVLYSTVDFDSGMEVCQLRYHAAVDSKVCPRPDIDSGVALSAAL